MKETATDKWPYDRTYERPYVSIMRDIDGKEMEKFKFGNELQSDKVKKYWYDNRELILYKTIESIKQKPIALD